MTVNEAILVCESSDLNVSERARQHIAPILATMLSKQPDIGLEVESIFSMFWKLARKADDMMDDSQSSDKKWLVVLESVFSLCSKTQGLSQNVPAARWFDVTSHFFSLMGTTCRGEADDLVLNTRPSHSDYEKMVLKKTGPWFTGRIECTALAYGVRNIDSSLLQNLNDFGNFTTLAYQIRNDIKDFESGNKDASTGKLNYPSLLLTLKESSIGHSGRMQIPFQFKEEVVDFAHKMASSYEKKASRSIAAYGRPLEELTSELCSSK